MSAKKILVSHKGRKCRTPGCKRALSIYNHNLNCHIHLNQLSEKMQWEESDTLVKRIDRL